MKIEKLIEKLQELQKEMPEAEVRLNSPYGEKALFVCALDKKSLQNHKDLAGVVWLECESDNDMGEEIQARFDNAIDKGLDEVDVYSGMLEIGIDVDMVRRYTDDETANHMQAFCEEHGLL